MNKNALSSQRRIKLVKCTNAHLTENGKFIIWQKSVCFIHEEVSPNEFLETPVFALYKSVCSLAFYIVHQEIHASKSARLTGINVAENQVKHN